MITVTLAMEARIPYTEQQIKSIVAIAARYEKKIHGRVDVAFVGPRQMRRLNHQYRGKDNVTDVLSFSWHEGKRMPDVEPMLGELYVCFSKIKQQANEFAVPVEEELVRMLAHGLLHLVGYDHVKPRDATKMFAKQERIVQSARNVIV